MEALVPHATAAAPADRHRHRQRAHGRASPHPVIAVLVVDLTPPTHHLITSRHGSARHLPSAAAATAHPCRHPLVVPAKFASLLSSLLQWGLRRKASTGISYYSSAHHAIGIGICALSEFVYRSIPTEDIDHACGARSRMNLKEIERERVGKEQEMRKKKKER